MAYSKKYEHRFKKVVVSLDRWGIERATMVVHSVTPGIREIIVPQKKRERREQVAKAKTALAMIIVFGTLLFLTVFLN